ncbi:MAG: SapC family protein [Porticoccaceae bacterium]|nr:SapC family protein [Porticoccaceae bacterium]
MSKAVLLNNVEHKDLKIDSNHSAEYGDNVNRALAFSSEFDDLHKEYPILFYKDAKADTFQAHVILGFEKDENLFLGDDGWLGNYVPAVLARGPFLIGFQSREVDGKAVKEPVIHIDMDNPRVGTESGQPLFLAYGGDTPYLEKVMQILQVVHQGAVLDDKLFSTLDSMGLFEPVNIEISLSNISSVNLSDYYCINKDKLAQLDAENLQKLNKAGALGLVYFALSSMGNFNKLIELKNKKMAIAQ